MPKMTVPPCYLRRIMVEPGAPPEVHVLKESKVFAGRSPKVAVRCVSKIVSRQHCQFEYFQTASALHGEPLKWTVTDLGSANGTYVNGRTTKPNQPMAIDVGCTIGIGGPDVTDPECFVFIVVGSDPRAVSDRRYPSEEDIPLVVSDPVAAAVVTVDPAEPAAQPATAAELELISPVVTGDTKQRQISEAQQSEPSLIPGLSSNDSGKRQSPSRPEEKRPSLTEAVCQPSCSKNGTDHTPQPSHENTALSKAASPSAESKGAGCRVLPSPAVNDKELDRDISVRPIKTVVTPEPTAELSPVVKPNLIDKCSTSSQNRAERSSLTHIVVEDADDVISVSSSEGDDGNDEEKAGVTSSPILHGLPTNSAQTLQSSSVKNVESMYKLSVGEEPDLMCSRRSPSLEVKNIVMSSAQRDHPEIKGRNPPTLVSNGRPPIPLENAHMSEDEAPMEKQGSAPSVNGDREMDEPPVSEYQPTAASPTRDLRSVSPLLEIVEPLQSSSPVELINLSDDEEGYPSSDEELHRLPLPSSSTLRKVLNNLSPSPRPQRRSSPAEDTFYSQEDSLIVIEDDDLDYFQNNSQEMNDGDVLERSIKQEPLDDYCDTLSQDVGDNDGDEEDDAEPVSDNAALDGVDAAGVAAVSATTSSANAPSDLDLPPSPPHRWSADLESSDSSLSSPPHEPPAADQPHEPAADDQPASSNAVPIASAAPAPKRPVEIDGRCVWLSRQRQPVVPVVEPPHMPPRQRRRLRLEADCPEPPRQRRRRRRHVSAEQPVKPAEPPPPTMSHEELQQQRRRNLKRLASAPPDSAQRPPVTKRHRANAKAKVTNQSRGAFLTKPVETAAATSATSTSAPPPTPQLSVIAAAKPNVNLKAMSFNKKSARYRPGELQIASPEPRKPDNDLTPEYVPGGTQRRRAHAPHPEMLPYLGENAASSAATTAADAPPPDSARAAQAVSDPASTKDVSSAKVVRPAKAVVAELAKGMQQPANQLRTPNTLAGPSVTAHSAASTAGNANKPSVSTTLARTVGAATRTTGDCLVAADPNAASLAHRSVRWAPDDYIRRTRLIAPMHAGKKVSTDMKRPSHKKDQDPSRNVARPSAAKTPDPVLLHTLWYILGWRYIWIKEQLNGHQSRAPDVAHRNGQPLDHALYQYQSHSDYVNTLQPLLLHSLWESVVRTASAGSAHRELFVKVRWNREELVDMPSDQPPRAAATERTPERSLLLLGCDTVVPLPVKGRKCVQPPGMGSLVVLDLPLKRQQATGRTSYMQVFAYVKAVESSQRDYQDRLHESLSEFAAVLRDDDCGSTSQRMSRYSAAFYHISLRARSKLEMATIDWQRIMKIRWVSDVRPGIRMFSSVHQLKSSVLCAPLLRPGLHRECFTPPPPSPEAKPQFQTELNEEQMRAVVGTVRAITDQPDRPSVICIHGPPGTGKTKMLVNLVKQLLVMASEEDQRPVLLCAPSNAAVDEFTRRLNLERKRPEMQNRQKLVRFGREEQIASDVVGNSLDNLVKADLHRKAVKDKENYQLTESQQAELEDLGRRLDAMQARIKAGETSLKTATDQLSQQMERIRQPPASAPPSQKALRDSKKFYLQRATVITCTLTGSVGNLLEHVFKPLEPPPGSRQPVRSPFRCCIVDEASQATEPETLIPLQYGINKLVLVGDPCQLPPTVQSREALQHGLGRSLLERLQLMFQTESCTPPGASPVVMLGLQYRMPAEVAHWPSARFYNNRLRTAEKVARLRVPLRPYTLLNIDYNASGDGGEVAHANSARGGFSNPLEAALVVRLVRLCQKITFQSGERPASIGVITPYSRQVDTIGNLLEQSRADPFQLQNGAQLRPVEVRTVDGFQGRELDVVLVSCVRANSQGGVGFLCDGRRMNVALTRARRCLVLCGSFDTLRQRQVHWAHLVKDAGDRNCLVNVDVRAALNDDDYLRRLIGQPVE